MRAILQSCLECLEQLNGMIDYVHEETLRLEIMEVHARFTELLASCQSQVTIEDSSGWDSSVDIQAISRDGTQTITPVVLDEPGAITPLFTPPNHFLLLESLGSVRVMGPPPEPGGQLSQDLLLRNASGLISHELSVQPFLTQHSTYSEEHIPPGCSARRDQRLPSSIMQSSQEKMKCAWYGCWKFVKKGNLTRHVNEIHLRKIKAVCTRCRKEFTRPYLKKNHICRIKM
ncbi:hypothetical protein BDR07DRAFT_1609057 [Suillus spraguei]|nr:hypothetical protein BDR07DRAFT_1609057 [Suillus spraguei]